MNIIKWLEEWYRAQCNGCDEIYWEELYGIEIVTTDNPGWLVKIDLEGTDYSDKPFDGHEMNNSDNIECYIKDKQFVAFGELTELENILQIFKKWVEQ